MTNLHATLKRKTTYYTGQYNYSYLVIASTVNFYLASSTNTSSAGVKVGYLNVPNSALPSINNSACDILKVHVLPIVNVALVFKLPGVENLTVSIPITIGNDLHVDQHYPVLLCVQLLQICCIMMFLHILNYWLCQVLPRIHH